MNRRNFLQGLLAAGVVTLVQPTVPFSSAPYVTAIDPAMFDNITKITMSQYSKILADSITRESIWEKIIQNRLSSGLLRESSE